MTTPKTSEPAYESWGADGTEWDECEVTTHETFVPMAGYVGGTPRCPPTCGHTGLVCTTRYADCFQKEKDPGTYCNSERSYAVRQVLRHSDSHWLSAHCRHVIAVAREISASRDEIWDTDHLVRATSFGDMGGDTHVPTNPRVTNAESKNCYAPLIEVEVELESSRSRKSTTSAVK